MDTITSWLMEPAKHLVRWGLRLIVACPLIWIFIELVLYFVKDELLYVHPPMVYVNDLILVNTD